MTLSLPRLSLPRLSLPGLLLTVALVLTGAGCSSMEARPPALADSTLVTVLAELHLAEARAEAGKAASPALRDSVFTRHDVSPEAFDAAMAYYAEHPEAFLDLFTRVVDRLSADRSELLDELRREAREPIGLE